MELIITNHPRIRRGARVERDEATAKKLIALKWAIPVNQQNQSNVADQQRKMMEEVNHPTQKPLRLSNKMLEQAVTKYRKGKK